MLLHQQEEGEQFHVPGATQFWTPVPAAMLRFEKSDRDFLGGWTAQGSARVSSTEVANMQKAVMRATQERVDSGASGKRGVRTLHRLGACYPLPDVDYGRYTYSGTDIPLKSEFDVICTLCWKKVWSRPNESSGSQVSSSTSEGELQ